jgi:carbonic anhydrase
MTRARGDQGSSRRDARVARVRSKPWSYFGEAGPAHWAGLSEAYALCSKGIAQSPIDLTNPTHGPVPALTLQWGTVSSLRLLNTGHTLQVVVPSGQQITLGGVAYDLTQFHFHTPSEHHLAGVAYPMELHVVHVATDGAIAVLSILLQEGADHPGLDLLFVHIPELTDDALALVEIDTALELTTFLPADRTTFRYLGSLTTPPCSEGVDWVVFAEPITIAPDQLAAYQAVFAPDARPIQPHNGRPVLKGV